MSKIYIVTEGCYSDYHIVGVYDNPDLAEKAKQMSGGEIEEHAVNPHETELRNGMESWRIIMKQSGGVIRAARAEPKEDFSPGAAALPMGHMYCNCWAKSMEHAIKIASEKLATLLTEKAW